MLSQYSAIIIMSLIALAVLCLLVRKRSPWHIAILALVAANTVYQIIAIFFGWIVTVDAQHHYHHGPFYIAYLLVCLAINNLRRFRRDHFCD